MSYFYGAEENRKDLYHMLEFEKKDTANANRAVYSYNAGTTTPPEFVDAMTGAEDPVYLDRIAVQYLDSNGAKCTRDVAYDKVANIYDKYHFRVWLFDAEYNKNSYAIRFSDARTEEPEKPAHVDIIPRQLDDHQQVDSMVFSLNQWMTVEQPALEEIAKTMELGDSETVEIFEQQDPASIVNEAENKSAGYTVEVTEDNLTASCVDQADTDETAITDEDTAVVYAEDTVTPQQPLVPPTPTIPAAPPRPTSWYRFSSAKEEENTEIKAADDEDEEEEAAVFAEVEKDEDSEEETNHNDVITETNVADEPMGDDVTLTMEAVVPEVENEEETQQVDDFTTNADTETISPAVQVPAKKVGKGGGLIFLGILEIISIIAIAFGIYGISKVVAANKVRMTAPEEAALFMNRAHNWLIIGLVVAIVFWVALGVGLSIALGNYI